MMAHQVLLRLQHQKQQPCVTCCKQMAVTLVTNEAEAVREAEEDRLAKEAAEAEAAKKAEEDGAAREAAELASKTAEERQAGDAAVAAAAATWKTGEQRFALEAAQKTVEEHFSALPFSAKRSQSSKEATALATVSSTEAALEEAFAQVGKDDGAPVQLRLQHRRQHPWATSCTDGRYPRHR